MSKRRASTTHKRKLSNQRRTRLSFSEALSLANRRAHEQANRRSRNKRQMKSIWAAVAATDIEEEVESLGFGKRIIRWLWALLLLPICLVTSWTFLSRFSHATLEQGFWQTPEFWYFATGALLMIGWFWSGLLKSFFLYLYVLGHELTHVVFVIICRGKVTDFHVSTTGGYITTNKTNLLIALSPYFVPFWSLVFGLIYVVVNLFARLEPHWSLVFYGVIGMTWTFHMIWTLWMIPRDQPDLKENGTFLSLVVIYLANLLVLIALLCAAEENPLQYAKDFGMEWLRNALVSGDVVLRWLMEFTAEFRNEIKF